MSHGVAFVERPSQLAAVPDGFEPVALSPLVDLSGSLRRPEDWVTQAELELRGEANFERARSVAARLDHLLGEPGAGVRPGRWNAFELKVIYDAVTLKAHTARAILEAEMPTSVVVFTQRRSPPAGITISEYESIYADVVSCVAPELGVQVRRLPYGRARGRESALFRAARAGLSSFRGMRQAATWSHAPPARRGERVVFLDFSYSLPAIAEELASLGFEIWLWPNGRRLYQLGGDVVRLRTSPRAGVLPHAWRGDRALMQLFDVDGVSTWPAAQRYLERLVRRDVRLSVRAHAAARLVVERLRPRAVVTSVASYPRERAIIDAAKREGILTMVCRHGEFGMRDVPIVALEDLEVVDNALCWGEWEAELTRRYTCSRVETTIVGSPMIEAACAAAPAREDVRAKFGFPDDARVALYVPTGMSGNRWYASHRSPIDTLYFQHQVAVVRALLALEGWRIVIKEHPAIRQSAIHDWCSRFARRDVIVTRAEFSGLIHLADAVLLDLPSTTMPLALLGSAAVYVIEDTVARWALGTREHLTASGVTFVGAADIAARLRDDDPRGPRPYPRAASLPLLADGHGTAAARAAAAIATAVRG